MSIATGGAQTTARLAWLDALRGVAALAVAVHHASYHYAPGMRRHVLAWFDPGSFGVLVFFLVSGYIVPASLERSGSMRGFWISRVFRIYPLLIVAVAAAVLLAVTGVHPLQGYLGRYDVGTAVLAHTSMLQDLLGVPSAINVLWTLSYEMAFYLLVVAFFAVRVHQRSAAIAVGIAAAGLTVGGLLPSALLTRGAGLTPVVIAATLLFVLAVCGACLQRPGLAQAGALLGGALATVLVTLNSRIGAWQGLIIIAVMFTGTAIYRAERGQVGRRAVVLTAAVTLGCALAAGAWQLQGWPPGTPDWEPRRAWMSAVVLAALVFAVGMALRRRRVPRWLAWLGVVSYSVYLLHPVLLVILDALFWRPSHDRPELVVAFLAALLALCWLSYRLVEAPMQRLGRRLARRRSPKPAEAAHEPAPSRTDTVVGLSGPTNRPNGQF